MAAELIAFEGIDGSGKGTQAARLCETLNAHGRTAAVLSFPQYQQTFFGRQIGEMLDGKFGPLSSVAPWAAALLFAGDRWESLPKLREMQSRYDVVILDRYVASNIAHQAGRVQGEARARLRKLIEQLEFEVYQVPRPNRILLLDLPVDSARQLVAAKKPRTYTEKAADLLESDANHLAQTREAYLELAAFDPTWQRIDMLYEGQLRTVDDIAAEIWQSCGR